MDDEGIRDIIVTEFSKLPPSWLAAQQFVDAGVTQESIIEACRDYPISDVSVSATVNDVRNIELGLLPVRRVR